MRFAGPARGQLGVPTTFNFLGPLANPSRPAAQAVGVADPRMAQIIAGVLATRGVDGFVFRGDDGLDELTTTTTSRVWAISGGEVSEHVLDPGDLGIAHAEPADLMGGDVDFNVAVVRRLLAGEPGPVRDAVVLNAAAGIAAFEAEERPLVDRLAAGADRARQALDSGDAQAVLDRWLKAVAQD
jgi:anthranilate phosphoribosyltransferase